MLPQGSNHLLCYVRLDERANDLRTTTSPTQALSDEYDNNSGLVPVEHSRGHPDRQSHLQTTGQTLQKQDTTTSRQTETTDTY